MNREFRAFAVIFGFGLIGVMFAVLEYEMYSRSIIVNELVTGGITLQAIQIFTVMIFQIAGVFIGATQE